LNATAPRLHRPREIAEALALAAEPGARLAAGATLMQLEWARGAPRPTELVDLSRVPGLSGVGRADGTLRIGALTRLSQLCTDGALKDVPLLREAARQTAGPSIRNLATIGGNVASRIGCLLGPLLVFDAELELLDASGSHRVRLADWLDLTDSRDAIVSAILVPTGAPAARTVHRKIGLRAAFSPSVIGASGALWLEGDRIARAALAVAGGIMRPQRLAAAEGFLVGQSIESVNWSSLRSLLIETIDAPDDAFRSGAYRRTAAANALVHGLGGTLPAAQVRRSPQKPRPAHTGEDEAIALDRATAGDRWHMRPDGPDKIAARLDYLTDHRRDGMLVGRILRADVPHARILRIDTAMAEALPGVVAVVTAADVPALNGFGIMIQDQPALCADKVRYVGDAVAAVAAIDAATAARALALIEVDYELLPVVADMDKALASGAAQIHTRGNLLTDLSFTVGEPETAFARAAHIVEAEYFTSRQMHGFMETEGGYVVPEPDGGLTVCVGAQYGRRDRLQLSRILGIPEERIRVVSSPTGGAFGGKDELTVQAPLALLALKAKQPVRLQLERTESVAAGTKRHPMRIRMRTACDVDGRLLAQEVDLVADGGAYASLGPAVVETALEHAAGPYFIPNQKSRGRLAYTNNGVCGAFRGFGANQMSYALECQIDSLAALCGLDPAEMRERNLRKPGMAGPLGQVVAPTERLDEMLAAARSDPLWNEPPPADDGEHLHGTGMALCYQGTGLGTLPDDPAGGALRLAPDGRIEALLGLDEIGQGALPAIQACVAAELGCGRDDVRPIVGDTGITPEAGSTTASRGTYVVWRVARETSAALRGPLLAAAATVAGRNADELVIAPGGFAERGSNSGDLLLSFETLAEALDPDALPDASVAFDFPKSDYRKGNARLIFAFGATVARIAVSRVTGQVRVLALHQHTAAGPVLDLSAYLGQVEGGSIQGLGFTLTEDALMRDGRYVATNFDTYMMPSIADVPDTMRVHALESLDPADPYGPRGVGELALGTVTPAIANAVRAATGFLPRRTPIDPYEVLAALGTQAP